MNVKTENGNSRKKIIIIAACVLAFIGALVLAFFLLKDAIFVLIAQSNAEKGKFSSAQSVLENVENEKADALKEYISLRTEINTEYSSLITGFDEMTVRDWAERASKADAASEGLSEQIRKSISALSGKLNSICSLYDEYQSVYPDLLELMDVFNEVNRLYTKDYTGHNTPFTISEEKNKIARWNELLSEAQAYTAKLPSEDRTYLLSYMLKEAQGEIRELDETMDRLLETSGVSETDEIMAKGDGQKIFPSVESSSGVSVNLTEKYEYAEHISDGVYRTLIETLGEYYKGL